MVPVVPVITTFESVLTGTVRTENETLVAPTGTMTESGTAAIPGDALTSATVVPPSGACPVNVTFPVIGAPPGALTGLNVAARIDAGLMVIVNVLKAPLRVAFHGTAVSTATTGNVAENVAVSNPASTRTVDGAVMPARPLVRLTTQPPSGAFPVNLTVPVTVVPPTGVLLGNASDRTRGAKTFKVPVTESEPVVPVITTFVSTEVTAVDAVNSAVVAFAGTVTVAGTTTSGFALIKETTVPPAGAGVCNVTIPGVDSPPVTAAGENVTVRMTGAAMTNVPDF